MHIHLIGVGGVAMGNLAAMLRASGNKVTGSDTELYPPMSDRLKEWKIETLPFDKKNVKRPDLVIVGNVISRGNPEVEAVLDLNKNYMSMPAALNEFFLKKNRVIVVAGTHGKTTTTFLTDHLLSSAGKKPGLFAGGVRSDGHPGWRIGNSGIFVIEGDEYDTAFFDKQSKFMHYRPFHLILTSVEFDHADIFDNMDQYLLSFQRLLRLVPGSGKVIANADSPYVRKLLSEYKYSPIQYYASKASKHKKLTDVSDFQRKGNSEIHSRDFGILKNFPLIGDYNILNSIAAMHAAKLNGIDIRDILERLSSFPGVMRRQQKRAENNQIRSGGAVVLIEDFAHHPTAVKATIEAVKKAYPGRKITALFEPRSATSHRNIFQEEYVLAFKPADDIYICEIYNPGKVSANERLDVEKIVKNIQSGKSKKGSACYCKNPEDLCSQVIQKFSPSKKGDVILAMSNGAFGGIYTRLEKMISTL